MRAHTVHAVAPFVIFSVGSGDMQEETDLIKGESPSPNSTNV